MLARLEVRLKSEQQFDYGISSLMQGVLMEFVKPEYAEDLHKQGLNPYSQHLEFTDGSFRWIITTFTEEAKEQIIDPILQTNVSELFLKHKNASLGITGKTLELRDYKQLLEETFFGQCKPYLNMAFITPTAFKVDGRYQFYPTVSHIFKSLIRRHDSIAGNTEVYSEQLIKEIEERLEVTRYNLRSTRFELEGVKVPAFTGSLGIRIHGGNQLANLIHMLAEFGEYTGVGIKTSIGMGAIRLIQNKGRKESFIGQ